MLDIFRMDSRRLFQSRTFYIMLAITLALIVFVCLMLSIMSSPQVLRAMEESGAEVEAADYQMGADIAGMSQLAFVHECLANGFILILAGMGMTFFAGGDFAGGYIKNICFARPRRWEYIASKTLIGGVYSGVMTLLAVLFSLALPPLFGLHPTASGIGDVASYTFWLWLPTWAFSLMALALVLLTRSSTLGIILSMVAGSGLTAMLAGTLCSMLGLPHVEQYFLNTVVSGVNAPQVGLILACTLVWSLIYAAGSLLFMEKRDI